MFQRFMGATIAKMRDYAGLNEAQLGKEVGRSAKTIERLEKNDRRTPIKRELEDKIVEVTGVTKAIFAQFLAETASKYLGVRLVVLPSDALVPSINALKAVRLFSDHGYKLDKEERESIRRMVIDLRCDVAESERRTNNAAEEISRRINNVRIKLGEDPSADSEG